MTQKQGNIALLSHPKESEELHIIIKTHTRHTNQMITHSIDSIIQLWLLKRNPREVLFLPEIGYLGIERIASHIIQGQGIMPASHSVQISGSVELDKQILSLVDIFAHTANIELNHANNLYDQWLNNGYTNENGIFMIPIHNTCTIGINANSEVGILEFDAGFELMLNPARQATPIELILSSNLAKEAKVSKKAQRRRSTKNENINFYLWMSVILGIMACVIILYSYLPAEYAAKINLLFKEIIK